MTIKQRVKMCCIKNSTTLSKVSTGMNMSLGTLSNRLKVGKFYKKEMEKMAECIGCTYRSYFEIGDKIIEKSDNREQIEAALTYAGKDTSAIRLKGGKFTEPELEKIAATIGGKYKTEFRFKDGTVI